MVHQAEKAKDVSHICLQLVPLPGFDGEGISFMDFIDLFSQKDVAFPFENHDKMAVAVMFEGRETILFYLEIAELHREVRFIVKKDLLRHVPKDSGIFFINMGLDSVPAVFVCMKMISSFNMSILPYDGKGA